MLALVLVVLAVVVALLLLVRVKSKAKVTPAEFPYLKREHLLTEAELSFFVVLRMALGDHVYVCPQVSVEEVIVVRPGLDRSKRQSARNRVNRMRFDFLVCKPDDFTPLFAVELDDRSHNRADRRRRDAFLDKVCSVAGLRIVHVQVQRSYTVQELRALLFPGSFSRLAHGRPA